MKYLFIFFIVLFFASCTSKSISGFYTNNDSLVFTCNDIISASPYQNKKGIIFVDVKFTKEGLNKICNFTKTHNGEKFDFKVNGNSVASNILIREAISCNNNGVSPAPIIFNNAENVYLFKKSVCLK